MSRDTTLEVRIESPSREASIDGVAVVPMKTHWVLLFCLVLGYSCLFAFYYPTTHGIEDEAGFMNQALIWSKGSTSTEGAGLGELYDTILVNGHHVSWRNPGRSLLILPFFLIGGMQAAFASGAMIHIAICLVGALILVRLGASPLYASLLLCHPTLAIYSRTIMGDAPAALCVLLVFYAIVGTRRPGLWAGLALALGTVMRMHSVVALPFVAAALFLSLPRESKWREAIACSVTGMTGVLAMTAYNLVMLDSFVAPFSPSFNATFAPSNLTFYVAALTCVWPVMILAPLVVRSSVRWYVVALCIPLLTLLCFYYWFDKGPTVAETVVLGQRLLQPVIPVWIVAYAVATNDSVVSRLRGLVSDRFIVAGLAVAGVLLLCGVAVAFRAHQAHLQRLVDVRTELSGIVPDGSLVIGNGTLRKVFGVPYEGVPAYDWEYMEYFGDVLDHSTRIADEPREWFVAFLLKSDSPELAIIASGYADRYGMIRIPTKSPGLVVYRASPLRSSVSDRRPDSAGRSALKFRWDETFPERGSPCTRAVRWLDGLEFLDHNARLPWPALSHSEGTVTRQAFRMRNARQT